MEPTRSRDISTDGYGRRAVRILVPLVLLLFGSSCKNLNVFSLDDDSRLGAEAYAKALGDTPRITHGPAWRQVKRVTDCLVAAARERNPGVAGAFDWEVRLLDDADTVNAYCLPGGKMAVYSAILPVAGDDAGLATVLGHEIAHATLRHGTERLTRSLGLELVLALALGEGDEETWRMATNLLLTLPHGRSQELEADRRGLFYMAAAGYDPRAAVGFWSRMASLGGAAPEFLSTHPSDEHRMRALKEALPEALALWESVHVVSYRIPQTLSWKWFMVFLPSLNTISDGTFPGRLPA
jgi:predicted Zn-dependent protease